MTKHPRNHTLWTNTEIEEDAAGYLRAQAAYNADQAAEEQKERDAADLVAFEKMFLQAGGTKSEARAAYEARRNQRAAEAAETADEQARRHLHGVAMGGL